LKHLTQEQINKALKISILEGVLGVTALQFFGGPYITGYFLWLKASPIIMGIFGSIPFLANSIQILAPLYSNKIKSRKKYVFWLLWPSRTSFLSFAFIPLLPEKIRIPAALSVFMYTQIAAALSVPAWQSWMADLVPRERLGRYFGLRNLILGFVQVPTMLIAGNILDSLGKDLLGFAVLFLTAGIVGFFDGLVFKFQDEPPYIPRESSLNLFKAIRFLMKYEHYKNFLSGFVLWYFALGLIGPYINVMLIKELEFNYTTIGLLNAIGMLVGTVFQPFWGKAGDKYGFQYFLKLCILMQAFAVLMWALAIPSFFYVLITQIFIGIFIVAGTGPLIFNTLVIVSPEELKTEAFAIFNGSANFALFLGSLLSGVIVSLFQNVEIQIGLWKFTSIRMTLLTSFALRLIAAIRISRIDIGPAQKVGFFYLVKEMYTSNLVPWMGKFWSIIRERTPKAITRHDKKSKYLL